MPAPRSKPLQFWATPEEWRAIYAAARTAGARSISAWLRDLALREAARLARRDVDPALARARQQAAQQVTVEVLRRELVAAT